MGRFLPMAAVAFWLCLAGPAKWLIAQDTEPSLQTFLLERSKANAVLLNDISITWTSVGVSYATGTPETRSTTYGRFCRTGGRFYKYSYGSTAAFHDDARDGYVVSDGTYLLDVLRSSGDDRSTGGVVRRCPAPPEMDPNVTHVNLSFVGWHTTGIDPQDILAKTECVVVPTSQLVEGIETYLVTFETQIDGIKTVFKYWLAPEFSYNPVKYEIWSAERLFTSCEYSDFMRLSNGVYFPQTSVTTLHKADGKPSTGWTRKVLAVECNPVIDPGAFDTSLDGLPSGYYVEDAITGMNYSVGVGPVSDQVVKEITESAAEDFPGIFTPQLSADGSEDRGVPATNADVPSASQGEVQARAEPLPAPETSDTVAAAPVVALFLIAACVVCVLIYASMRKSTKTQ